MCMYMRLLLFLAGTGSKVWAVPTCLASDSLKGSGGRGRERGAVYQPALHRPFLSPFFLSRTLIACSWYALGGARGAKGKVTQNGPERKRKRGGGWPARESGKGEREEREGDRWRETKTTPPGLGGRDSMDPQKGGSGLWPIMSKCPVFGDSPEDLSLPAWEKQTGVSFLVGASYSCNVWFGAGLVGAVCLTGLVFVV